MVTFQTSGAMTNGERIWIILEAQKYFGSKWIDRELLESITVVYYFPTLGM